MSMTRKEIDRQSLLVVNDKISKDIKLLVSPSNFQVGIEKKFSTLKVVGETIASGGLSVSTSAYSSGQTVDDSVVVALVTGGGSITLPKDPRDGHVVFVKDANGSAAATNIVVSAGGLLIDATQTNVISTNYQSKCYMYYSNRWYVIS